MLTPNVIFRASSQQHACAQSKNLYYSKLDVSTTVDMTSTRFFSMWVNCYIITKNNHRLDKPLSSL